MSRRRTLCFALAAILTSSALPALATTTTITLNNNRTFGSPVKTGDASNEAVNDVIIMFDRSSGNSITLTVDGQSWGPNKTAVLVEAGDTLTLDTISGSGEAHLEILNATGGGIKNHQIDDEAKLELRDIDSAFFMNNRLTSSGTEYIGGGGIFILSESNNTELVISNDAELYLNRVTINSSDTVRYSGGGAAYAATKDGSNFATIEVGSNSVDNSSFFAGNSVTIGGAAHYSGGGALAALGTGTNGRAFIAIGSHSNFDGNTVTLKSSHTSTKSGGGAVFMYAVKEAQLDIYEEAYFTGNSVTSANGNYNGGGAIYIASDNKLGFHVNPNSLFSDNRADVGTGANSGGGAILAQTSTGEGKIIITGGTRFENNSTTGKGGAIAYFGGTSKIAEFNLDTGDGIIAFSGNLDGATYNANGTTTGGTANAIHLDGNVNILVYGDNDIFFDDPITSGTSGSTTFLLGDSGDEFTGMAQFKGISNFTGDFKSETDGLTHLADNATIKADNIIFADSDISGQGTLKAAGTISFTTARIRPDSDVFSIPAISMMDREIGTEKAATVHMADAAKSIGEINLNADGGDGVKLSGVTLAVDLSGPNSSDKLVVDNLNRNTSSSNKIDITTWDIGEYTIMQADSGNITIGNNSDNFIDVASSSVTVGGLALAGRMAGKVTLDVTSSGKYLTLKTETLTNATLSWDGNPGGGDWNFTDANWSGGATTFAAGDKVTFDYDSLPNMINVAGQTNATNDYSVQVSDMAITADGYSFYGGAIIGRANSELSGTTGKLAVDGASADFYNTLDFEGGIELDDTSVMRMVYSTNNPQHGGFISGNTTVNFLDAYSTLKFDLDLDNGSDEHVYAHNGAIKGAGTLEIDLSASATGGYMLLSGDNKDFDGNIEVQGHGTGYDSGLILTRPTAAGTAGIKLENNNTSLNLNFDPTDPFTYNFTNAITVAPGSEYNDINIYGGRVALGGVANFGGAALGVDDGVIRVHDGGVLAFKSDATTQTAAYTVGGIVVIKTGGVVVGGQGGKMTGTLDFGRASILELAADNKALKMAASSTLEVLNDSVGKRLKTTDTWTAGQSYAILDVSDIASSIPNNEKSWLTGDLSTAVSRGVLDWNGNVLYYNHIGSNTISELAYEAGFSSNQRQTAKGVDSLNHNGSLYNTVAGLNRGEVAPALDQLSGQPIAAAAGIARQNAVSFNNSVISQSRSLRGSLAAKGSGEPYFKTIPGRSADSAPATAAAPSVQPRPSTNSAAGQRPGLTYSPEARRTVPAGAAAYQTVSPDGRSLQPSFGWSDDEPLTQVWLSLGYDRTNYDAAGGHHAATARGPQAAIGLEHSLDNEWFVGAAFHYSNQEIKQSKFSAKTDIDAFTIGIYGGREAALGRGALRLTMGAGYSFFDFDAERKVRIPGLTEKLTADYDGSAWQFFGEAAYGFRLTDYLALEPYLNLSYVHQKIDGFREHGGTSALKTHSQSDDDFYTTLGSRLSAALGSSTTLELDLGWQHRFGDRWGETTMSFAQGSTPFTIEAAAPDRDLALVSLGLNQAITESLAMKLNYNGAYGSDSRRHGGQAMISYSF